MKNRQQGKSENYASFFGDIQKHGIEVWHVIMGFFFGNDAKIIIIKGGIDWVMTMEKIKERMR